MPRKYTEVCGKSLYNYIKEGCSGVGVSLFFQASSDWTRGNGLHQERITLEQNAQGSI